MSQTPERRILVTSALPYANGPLHLGHILEGIQADIWARFQRLRGHDCIYLCADDAHGTAIMLSAEAQGQTPEEMIARMYHEHLADLQGFGIHFDCYHTTHSEENRHHSERIYQLCRAGGHIAERDIVQAYDPERKLFLADRLIRGDCPRCGAEDQYGDHCESCGAHYAPAELRRPRSALSGAEPTRKSSRHLFFRLPQFADSLRKWVDAGHLQKPVAGKLREWLDAGLREWDISRDAPYFGFEIPDAPGKYFYVWLDAPIGYMASCQRYCEESKRIFDDYWAAGADTELHHFIGKDIINFHGLFWPALLEATGHRCPTSLHVHGFLGVNGKKMSKSRGTFLLASDYLKRLDADYLRYYFAARLGAEVEDIDLELADFTQRVNADLIGKLVNLASRAAQLLERHCDRRTSTTLAEPALIDACVAAGESIAGHYEARRYSRAMREIMRLADDANRFVDRHKPWELARKSPDDPALRSQCTTALELFRLLSLYLKPVVPSLTARSETLLAETLDWAARDRRMGERQLAPFQPLLQRIDPKNCAALIQQ